MVSKETQELIDELLKNDIEDTKDIPEVEKAKVSDKVKSENEYMTWEETILTEDHKIEADEN